MSEAGTGNKALGARIRALRLDRGLTLAAAAERAGISLPYLSEIERGRRLPSLDVLARVARALDSSAVRILRGVAPFDSNQGEN